VAPARTSAMTSKPTSRRVARQVFAVERSRGCDCLPEIVVCEDGIVVLHKPDCPVTCGTTWHVPVVGAVAEWRVEAVSLRVSP
jgi:hypothetical protein